ncbi:glycine oxidase [Oceanibaculum pacificum]|uniref:Glycine oxidase n=1 Tax=Oceanibaculum pacificum TaxID=580166 RepID=A0A154WF10_9PROT|nr:glycine oxidase [Oceanibaculum pacificum]
MARSHSIAIIGAGVSGLGIGWRLAQAGCHVCVFDRGQAGRGASWAAAGMLAANAEAEPGEEALLGLTLASQKMWPGFTRELEQASGQDIGYLESGTLVAATNRDELEQLRFTFEYQRGLGLAVEWLNGVEARRREPYLRSGIPGAIWAPTDHQVDNRKLAEALKAAYLAAGGGLYEGCAVTGLDLTGGRVTGVQTGDKTHKADSVVLAAGSWSRDLPGLPPLALPPVRPVKGQMLSLRMNQADPVVKGVLWAPKIYLVPRADGRLIVGATVEEKGYDPHLTAGGVLALLDAAWRAIPAIEELPIEEMWVGYRPTSRDDAPILGTSGVDGLLVATGHHRNGILLAPITAEAIAREILTGQPLPEATPFTLERFRQALPAAG